MRYQPLLAATLIFLILRPIADVLFTLSVPISPLRYLVLLAGLYAIRDRPLLLAFALCLALGDMVLRSIYEIGQSALLLKLSHGLGFAAIVLVASGISADVFKGGEVTSDIIVGAVCMYFVIGVVWAFLYYLLELLAPGSILGNATASFHPIEDQRFTELLYLSVGALSSVGFLSNVPTTPLIGQLAVVEAVCGQLYLAVLIARLVGSHA
jgi:hypothetical protein